jgi:hypothetical protein
MVRARWLEVLLRGPSSLGPLVSQVLITLVIAGGAACTVYSGYIHLYLWGRAQFPYKDIPTIGPLFLMQGIVAVLIGLLIIATRRVWALLLGVGLMITCIAALVIDVEVGMFGFRDSWAVPYVTSTLYWEIVGGVLLLLPAAVLAWAGSPARSAVLSR